MESAELRYSPRGLDRLNRGLIAVGCALVVALNPMALMAAEASKPSGTGAAPAAATGTAMPTGTGATAAPATATTGAPGASGASGVSGASGAAAAPTATKLPPEQIDALVAPIALFPDDLLAQTLVASTYPLEIIQLQQWMVKHKDLKDKALADAVAKEDWDPSIQTMAAVPEVVKRLSDDIQWTTDLGNVFLEQQSEVMESVQRMRKKAKDKGALESNEQQKVETKVIEEKTVIVVQSSNPEVVYVPSYSPVAVYGPPVYPYPPIYYPYYAPGAAFVTFGVGMAMGAAIWGGSCCGCGWGGGGDVDINVNNNFNKNTNINNKSGNNVNNGNRGNNSGNRGNAATNKGGAGGGNKWSHNPQHRGAAPYGDKATANKFGGQAKGSQGGGRGPSASQQPTGGRGGGSPSAGNTAAGGARGGSPSASNRSGSGGGSGSRGSSPSASSRGSSGSKGGGFGGSGGGYSGSSARSAGSRGSSSFSGGGRGGGGRGGGGRGGGGRR
jgi:hypothetical protein